MSSKTGYTPNTFQYNIQTACALVPALLVLAGFGGQIVMGTFLVGSMITYILDAMQYREGSFAALWVTLAAANMGLIMSNVPFSPLRLIGIDWMPNAPSDVSRPPLLSLLLLLIGGQTIMFTGCWATLQFKWIQYQYPVVACALEQLVLQAALPISAAVQASGIIAAVGAPSAPFYLMVVLCAMYRMFCLPLTSSFSTGKGNVIQSKAICGLSALVVCLLPAATFVAMHWAVLFAWTKFWSLAILVSVPVLWICVQEEGLWWLGSSPDAQGVLRKGLALLALAVAVAGVEGRVVFRIFEQYVTIYPPWSYIVITAAMYGAAAVVVLHVTGVLGSSVDVAVGGVVLVLSTAGGCFAMGVPVFVIPAPLVAAAGLSLYYESRLLRDYLIFMAGAAAASVWFVHHHFWFLEIELGGLSVRDLCKLMLGMLLPALTVPGLVISNSSHHLVSLLLSVQAAMVAFVEEHLFAGPHGEEEMYPAYMVLATSLFGMTVAHRMKSAGKLSSWGAWVCHSCYASKLSMLAVPEAYMVRPVLLFALAVSAPLVLYPDSTAGLIGAHHRRAKLKPWQGILHAAMVVLTVVAGRFAVFDVIQWVTSSQPSEAVAAGGLLLASGIGCLPLVHKHYTNNAAARNAILGVCTLAALLFLLRPPFPVRTGSKCPHLPFGLCPRLWDESHAPYHEADDLAIYSMGEARRTHQPLWLLIAAVCCGLLALTPGARRGLPSVTALSWKLMVSGVSGSCVAGYVGLEFFRHCFGLQILLWGGMLLVASSVVLLQASSQTVPSGLLSVALWLPTFPVALVLEHLSPLPPLPQLSQRLHPDMGMDVDIERHSLRRASLLGVFAAQAVLIAFVIKLRIPSLLSQQKGKSPIEEALIADEDGGSGGPGGFLMRFNVPTACLPSMPFPAAGKRRSQGGEALWYLCLAGNGACLMAFFISLLLSLDAGGGGDANIFALAPLLLLLNRDDLLLSGLTQGRRYFPPVAAVVVYLGAGAANQILETTLSPHSASSRLALDASPSWYFLRNACCLMACLPTHSMFLKYLWDWQPQDDSQVRDGPTPKRWFSAAVLGLSRMKYFFLSPLFLSALV